MSSDIGWGYGDAGWGFAPEWNVQGDTGWVRPAAGVSY